LKTISNQSISNAAPARETRGRRRRQSFVERTLATFGRRMERAFYAEELAKKDGLLQRLDPRVKVIGLMLLLIDAALARNLFVIVGVFSIGFTLALLSRVPIRTLATRAWLSAFLFTGVIALPSIFITPGHVVYQLPLLEWPVTAQGLQSALYLLTRVETAVTLSLLLVLCTLWTHVLKALWVLGVPVVFIVILGMTYRYIFLMLQTARDMFESRQSRMIGVLDGPDSRRLAAAAAGVLLTKSFHLSGEVYLAMQSRGFRGEVDTLDDFKMRGRDWLALFLFVLVALLLCWLGRYSFAGSFIAV
jgi:cobalt ECF transporter T component CbiQ